MLVEFQRLILGEHAHGLDTGINAVGKREIDDSVLTAIGYGGFGQVLGEHTQAASLTAGQQHGHYFLFR